MLLAEGVFAPFLSKATSIYLIFTIWESDIFLSRRCRERYLYISWYLDPFFVWVSSSKYVIHEKIGSWVLIWISTGSGKWSVVILDETLGINSQHVTFQCFTADMWCNQLRVIDWFVWLFALIFWKIIFEITIVLDENKFIFLKKNYLVNTCPFLGQLIVLI